MLYLIAFFTAGAFIYGINPFIPALVMAVMLLGISDIFFWTSLVSGLAFGCIMNGDLTAFIKYTVIIAAVVFIYYLSAGRHKKVRAFSIIPAVFVIDIVAVFLRPDSINIPDSLINTDYRILTYALIICAELILMSAMTVIYIRALKVLIKKEENAGAYNEEMISILLSFAATIWGVPISIAGIISSLESVCFYGIIYVAYRLGSGYGMAFAGIAGMIMAIRLGSPEYVGAAFIIALCSLSGRLVRKNKKICALAGFMIGYLLAGSLYFRYLFAINGLKAAVPAVLLFAVTPRAWLTSHDSAVYNGHSAETARELNRITAGRIREMAGAFKRIEYTLAGCGNENIRINLGEIGSLIGRFSDNLETVEPVVSGKEELLRERFMEQGVLMTHMTAVLDEDSHKKYYISAHTLGRRIMLSRDAAKLLSEVMDENIRVAEDTSAIISETNRVIAFEEKCRYKCYYEVKRIKKYGSSVSGDNFSVKESADGRLVMMISDGMGSGSGASCESSLMVDTMEEMIDAGFDPLYAIEFANECITAQTSGSSFTTFDMGIIDLYGGKLNLYKQGAAPTYIIRAGGETSVEEVKSTTLPIGVLPQVECDRAEYELYDRDVVIMVSDGVFCGELSGMDEYIGGLSDKITGGNCREIMEELMTELLARNRGCFDDDVTVIVSTILYLSDEI